MSIQRWDDGIDCMEEEPHGGEYVTYNDHLADKAAALEIQQHHLGTAYETIKQQADQITRMKLSYFLLIFRNSIVDDFCEQDWAKACGEQDEEMKG